MPARVHKQKCTLFFLPYVNCFVIVSSDVVLYTVNADYKIAHSRVSFHGQDFFFDLKIFIDQTETCWPFVAIFDIDHDWVVPYQNEEAAS